MIAPKQRGRRGAVESRNVASRRSCKKREKNVKDEYGVETEGGVPEVELLENMQMCVLRTAEEYISKIQYAVFHIFPERICRFGKGKMDT